MKANRTCEISTAKLKVNILKIRRLFEDNSRFPDWVRDNVRVGQGGGAVKQTVLS